MPKLKIPTYRAHALKRRINRDMPRCKKFVSELWGIPEKHIVPKSIEVRKEKREKGGPACIRRNLFGSNMIFWAGSFSILPKTPDMQPDRVLVHELTHIALRHISIFGEGKTKDFIVEGLADFALEQYYMQSPLSRKLLEGQVTLLREVAAVVNGVLLPLHDQESADPLIYEENKYVIGKRFVRALYDAGHSPEQIHEMLLETHPKSSELYFPLLYLHRAGASFEIDPDCMSLEIQEWIQKAVKLGLEHVERPSVEPQKETRLERVLGVLKLGILPFAYPAMSIENAVGTVKKHWSGRDRKQKGAPKNLLPNPRKYGARFIAQLEARLGSLEKVLEVLEEFPPENYRAIDHPIGHIMDANVYLDLFVLPFLEQKKRAA